jgi:hypothetical protein
MPKPTQKNLIKYLKYIRSELISKTDIYPPNRSKYNTLVISAAEHAQNILWEIDNLTKQLIEEYEKDHEYVKPFSVNRICTAHI